MKQLCHQKMALENDVVFYLKKVNDWVASIKNQLVLREYCQTDIKTE